MLEELDYKKVFTYFEKISSIPRNSKYNERISNYLVSFAKERGLFVRQDSFYNVVIIKEASPGCENRPAVLLQGHMDMVCVKEEGVEHDFETEGLRLTVEGDFISAAGTTLGGDDGIAVAYALAILDDDTLVHPKLEIVITTDEEIGMDGAKGLDCSDLSAAYMLNLDSEGEGTFLSSCAGGLTALCTIPVKREKMSGIQYEITVQGLKGGHSGAEIDKIRANAVALLGRLLFELEEGGVPYALETMEGGTRDNVIPNAASALLVVKEGEEARLAKAVEHNSSIYREELKGSDPGLCVRLDKKGAVETEVLSGETLTGLLMMLLFAPEGIQKMSYEIPGLVESSLNLGTMRLTAGEARFSYGVRSSVSSSKYWIQKKLSFLAGYLGGSCSVSADYPAWEYKRDSRLREVCAEVFEEQYGYGPKIEAIHAGLECGIIADKMPGIDAVSLGPDVLDIHTTKERMSISSAKRVYDFVIGVLARLGQEG